MKGVLATIASGAKKGFEEPRELPDKIRAEIEADSDAVEYGRRATERALARMDGTRYDPETGEIIEESSSGARSGIQLTSFADIEPVIDVADFVRGLLVDNSVALAYGDSNVGKSFWATDLALHVAAGLEWNGRRVEQGGVVYAALEGGAGFKNRVAAWRAAHEVNGPVHFAAITAPLSLREPKDVRALAEAVEEAGKSFGYPVKLLVIDTVSRGMAGGDENSSADMGAFVRGIDRLREAMGAAILLVHHSGKDASKGPRGHSLLRAAVDTEIEITADEATGYRTVNVHKQRDLAKGVAISFRLDVVELGQNRHGEPVTTCVIVPGDQNHLYVNDRGKRTKQLPGDLEALLRTIQVLIIDEGVMGHPAPGMPEVKHGPRKALQARLLQNGWLCPPGTDDGVADGVADQATHIPKSEHQRLNKRLISLQNKGKIGFSRNLVWLV